MLQRRIIGSGERRRRTLRRAADSAGGGGSSEQLGGRNLPGIAGSGQPFCGRLSARRSDHLRVKIPVAVQESGQRRTTPVRIGGQEHWRMAAAASLWLFLMMAAVILLAPAMAFSQTVEWSRRTG